MLCVTVHIRKWKRNTKEMKKSHRHMLYEINFLIIPPSHKNLKKIKLLFKRSFLLKKEYSKLWGVVYDCWIKSKLVFCSSLTATWLGFMIESNSHKEEWTVHSQMALRALYARKCYKNKFRAYKLDGISNRNIFAKYFVCSDN
jgi:hypothetical protein